MKVPSAR